MRRIALGFLLLAGCGGNGNTPTRTITLGGIIDKTGSNAAPGWSAGANLAMTDVNAALKKQGKNLQFNWLFTDSTSTATVAQAAAKADAMQGAKGILVDTSSDDILVEMLNYQTDATMNINLPVVCFACTSPFINNVTQTDPDPVRQAALRNGGLWNYRTQMASTGQAAVMVRLALGKGTKGDVNGDGQLKISMYATNDAFGQGFSAAVAAQAMLQHPNPAPLLETVFLDPKVDPNSYDFASDMAKLADNHNETSGADDGAPDVVMPLVFPQYLGAAAKTYLNAGFAPVLLNEDALRRNVVLALLGATGEGQEGESPVISESNDSGKVFATELQALLNTMPAEFDAFSANAYDGAVVLMLGTLAAALDLPDPTAVTGSQVRDAMQHLNDPAGTMVRTGPAALAEGIGLIAQGKPINYDGASGPVDWDALGNVVTRLTHFSITGQQFVDHETYDCVASPDCPVAQ